MTAADTVVGRLDAGEQQALLATVRALLVDAPLLTPTAGGLPMSVRVTNAGPWGWWANRQGYRYVDTHPTTGRPWPPLPSLWREIFRRYAADPREPDAGHVVWYRPGARLGEHRDRTERDRSGSIVTVSLGDPATWQVRDEDGVVTRTQLVSGDVVVLEGPTRHLLHSIVSVDQEPSLFHPSPLDRPGRLAVSVRSGAGGR